MAPHPRKKAFNRGTFLLVDGAKYDVSNIVHESTELIPDEIQVLIRRCKWNDEHLYPSVAEIENNKTGESFINEQKPKHHRQVKSQESDSSQEDDESQSASTSYEYVTDDDSSSNSNDDSSSTSSSNVSSGRHLSGDESWNKGHESLASINWTPAPEKIEILKMMEQSGGRAQVPGAVCVGGGASEQTRSARKPPPRLVREESTPGAVHVDGPGAKLNQRSFHSFGKHKEDASKRELLDYKQPSDVKLGVAPPSGPARKRSSFSIDSYFSNSNDGRGNLSEPALLAEQQQQQYQDNQNGEHDSWDSGQIKAAAAAFDHCQISSQMPPSPPSSEQQRMVQITHDLELPLHGAHETTIALETGNVVTVVCLVCRATLRCISKAQYVLCPECKCLTPLNETAMGGSSSNAGGVGLGLLSAFDQSYRVGVS